ncbi:MAG: FG-GAP repeat domain-containing protein, partial [Gemmatimonadales bacterium]
RAARDGSPAGAPLEGAGAALGRARIALELTIPYQAALAGLRGPQTAVSGVPILTPPPEFAIRRRVGRDTTAPIPVTFVDASAAAGLPADWAGITGLDAADYDGDGRDDFAAAGQRFRLLHWAGSGWFDAAAAAGIDEGPAAAAGFADLDGDGRIDLMLVRPDGRAEGYRNGGDGRFTRIAGGAAGLGDVRALRFLDVDHDGDLDVVAVGSAGARLLRNDGTGTLEDLTDAVGLPTTATIDLGGADLDGDGLVDLIVLGADGVPTLLGNTGERRFVPRVAGFARVPGARALALGDYDNDGAIDLLVAGSGGVTAWRNEGDGGFARDPGATRGLAVSGLTDPVLGLTDYDNDGWLDVAVAGRDGAGAGLVRLRRNEGGGRFGDRSTVLPPDLPLFAALVTVDLGGDRDPDLIAAGPAGVRFLRNDGGNLNLAVELRLTGLGTGSGKNNSLGIGSTVEVRAGNLYQKRVVTAASTLIGIGYRLKADVVRVEWPNGVPQTLYTPGNDQDVVEQQVLKSSCAFLYAWDGTATRFVTDAMWRSALGMPVGIGGTGAAQYAPSAASREYVRIPGEALAPIDGSYRIQWTEELWETSYTDRLELVAVDHPDSVLVVVDERFTPSGPAVTLDLHHLADLRPPRLARDDRGVDQLDAVREHDFRYVADLVPTKYQGVTEPHALEIDLGPERGGSTVLVLRGWIFPTDASINVALSQGAGPEVVAPMLEARDPGGRWVPVEALGFPSGKDKTMVVDLTGRLPAGSRRIRIRSTMEVYWDQVAVAARAPAVATVTRLLPAAADLHYRGFSRVYRKGGRTGPHWFDYDAVTTDDPWRPIPGKLTRFGDVRPLLLEDDDRTVVMGPGDEMTVDFPAATAPALPA